MFSVHPIRVLSCDTLSDFESQASPFGKPSTSHPSLSLRALMAAFPHTCVSASGTSSPTTTHLCCTIFPEIRVRWTRWLRGQSRVSTTSSGSWRRQQTTTPGAWRRSPTSCLRGTCLGNRGCSSAVPQPPLPCLVSVIEKKEIKEGAISREPFCVWRPDRCRRLSLPFSLQILCLILLPGMCTAWDSLSCHQKSWAKCQWWPSWGRLGIAGSAGEHGKLDVFHGQGLCTWCWWDEWDTHSSPV